MMRLFHFFVAGARDDVNANADADDDDNDDSDDDVVALFSSGLLVMVFR